MEQSNYFSGMLRTIAVTAATVDEQIKPDQTNEAAFISEKKVRISPMVLRDQCAEYNKKSINLEQTIQIIKERLQKVQSQNVLVDGHVSEPSKSKIQQQSKKF
ncbi:unnamed protein product [Caenorhabditis bovis]|uniref:Uncharacterized protein n=1 Tax=Caenorhabditis bovis TaxID=2654633 RepID=A0A8S1F1M4_9PELO|nr:unnamed protein product [Caenorhabditis bovis]